VKKIFALLTLALMVFVVIYRQQVYVWDPLATVTRDDVKQGSVRVMINFSNDILMDDNSTSSRRIYLVQNWNKVAEFATGKLRCIEYLACMTDAEQATGEKLTPGPRGKREPYEGVTMTDRRIKFVDEHGALVEVVLR
jgi:hypothetical protein